MRWVRLGGWWSGALGAAVLAACGTSGSSPQPFGSVNEVGGSANGGTTIVTAGTLNVGATSSAAGQPSGLDACSAPALRFPITRYSAADVDASLDLVFGQGPRLADALAGRDAFSFVRALADVARLRVSEAATEAAELQVCDDEADDGASCVQRFLREYGSRLYRRPLEPQQLAGYLAPFRSTTDRRATAENALVSMVLSPYFALRLETATNGTLDGYGIAARLAHFATRSVPDAELSASAASGRLADPLERLSQLHRLWGTPAGRAARTRFALDLLGLPDSLESELDAELRHDLSAQTHALVDRVYEDHFGSFTTLLDTPTLPLNDRLADFYGVPPPGSGELVDTELDSALFAGLLTSGAFTTHYRHPSQRGVAIVKRLLCSEIPSPPAEHDFALPEGISPRDGLARSLAINPACSGCHRLFDPTGLALSAFDHSGHLSGLDSSGSVKLSLSKEPVAVSDPHELADAIAQSAEARVCLERRYLEHIVDRELKAEGQIFVRIVLPPDGAPLPSSTPDADWLTCMDRLLGGDAPNLTLISEAIVQSSLMLWRDDTPRRVVALDSSSDPIEHALAETQQLLGAYLNPDDDDALSLYLAALESARDAIDPDGTVGGAGGAP